MSDGRYATTTYFMTQAVFAKYSDTPTTNEEGLKLRYHDEEEEY